MIETPPRISPPVRWLLAVLVAGLPLVLMYVAYVAWADRLPDPLPSHWGSGGQVDGTTPAQNMFLILLAIGAAGVLKALVGGFAPNLRWRLRRILLTVAATVTSFAASLWFVIAGLALDHTDPYQAPAPSWHIAALLLVIAAWSGLTFLACGRAPAHPSAARVPRTGAPRLDLPDGQAAAWSEIAQPTKFAAGTVAWLLVLAGVIGGFTNPWAASPVVLSALLVFYLFTTRLLVDRRGLRVGFGPWGWPRITVPLGEIESVETVTVTPFEWGGWGYRVRPGGRAVITRGGPGVQLRLSDDRVFVFTTQDPETVAGLVNSLLDRTDR